MLSPLRWSGSALLITGALASLTFLSAAPALAEHTEGPPSLEEVQQMVEDETGWDIDWNSSLGRSARGAIIRGTTTLGGGDGEGGDLSVTQEFTITIECTVTFPPLRIRCRVSFEL